MAANNVKVELFYGSAWNDITSDVYTRDGIRITRGRPDESQRVPPSTLDLTIDNRDGTYSPRNPMSPLYGIIGRNTPIRVSVTGVESGLSLPGTSGNVASTPDNAALDITGDIDMRVDATLSNATWFTTGGKALLTKYDSSTNNRSYRLYIENGLLRFAWSNNGTAVNAVSPDTAHVPDANGRLAVRVTLDVDDGAGNRVLRFYTAPTLAGPWVQLGSTITTAGTTSIFNSTATMYVGADGSGGSGSLLTGTIHAAQVRSGINGTMVANPDFRKQAPGTTSFADSAGRTWTVNGTAAIVDVPSYRFVGEVESWPQRWSVDGNDAWTPITANGIMRRLNAPGTTKSALSASRRVIFDFTPDPHLVAYWPLEGGILANLVSPANPGLLVGGKFEAIDDSPGGSDGAIRVEPPDSILSGSVPYLGTLLFPTSYTPSSGSVTIAFAVRQQRTSQLSFADGAAPMRGAITIPVTGTLGTLQFAWLSDPNTLLTGTSATFGEGIPPTGVTSSVDLGDGNWHVIKLLAQVSGSDVNVFWYFDDVLQGGNTRTGKTLGQVVSVGNFGATYFDPDALVSKAWNLDLCQLVVFDENVPVAAEVLNGYPGETAVERIERLCSEEGVTVAIIGDADESETVGVQRVAPFLDLLFDAADADGGILYEPRDSLGLAYRVHASLYNQDPTLTLDYDAGGEVAPPLEPVEDTDVTGNDITVTRYQGSSARVVQETGTLNVQEPSDDPDGVGRYKRDFTLVLAEDSQCQRQAEWRKHLGTWDEARYPVVNVDLTAMDEAGKSTLIVESVGLDVGDRFSITNPPAWIPPDSIEQLAQGFSEDIGSHTWTFAINATPAGPYDVYEVETDTINNLSRIPAADGATTLNEALDTTETGVDIISATARWIDSTNYSSQFPFDVLIGGERMRVTACSGTGLTQTFTVTRSINGVVKSHSSGTDVQLFRPPVIAR